ncbi:hypothetical protein C5167_035390 [Papaver somniferum]|uniref:DUF2828 domain-containing protein n=1 Tax=Papaver somniferum TaxID=3469 RepID=A0A4Y7KJJ2_PAPSO|nr:hypothetical protein C5167_035390 [Papaver somniferum]
MSSSPPRRRHTRSRYWPPDLYHHPCDLRSYRGTYAIQIKDFEDKGPKHMFQQFVRFKVQQVYMPPTNIPFAFVRFLTRADADAALNFCRENLENHLKTLAINLKAMADFGYFKDLPELLVRLHQGIEIGKVLRRNPIQKKVKVGLDSEARYAYQVRDRLRKEYLVPLHKVLEISKVYMSSQMWESLPYNRVSSVAMKNYKRIFEETRSRKVAELQWRRMVDDMSKIGKLNDCLAICDVSGSMNGTPMGVSVALEGVRLNTESCSGREIEGRSDDKAALCFWRYGVQLVELDSAANEWETDYQIGVQISGSLLAKDYVSNNGLSFVVLILLWKFDASFYKYDPQKRYIKPQGARVQQVRQEKQVPEPTLKRVVDLPVRENEHAEDSKPKRKRGDEAMREEKRVEERELKKTRVHHAQPGDSKKPETRVHHAQPVREEEEVKKADQGDSKKPERKRRPQGVYVPPSRR